MALITPSLPVCVVSVAWRTCWLRKAWPWSHVVTQPLWNQQSVSALQAHNKHLIKKCFSSAQRIGSTENSKRGAQPSAYIDSLNQICRVLGRGSAVKLTLEMDTLRHRKHGCREGVCGFWLRNVESLKYFQNHLAYYIHNKKRMGQHQPLELRVPLSTRVDCQNVTWSSWKDSYSSTQGFISHRLLHTWSLSSQGSTSTTLCQRISQHRSASPSKILEVQDFLDQAFCSHDPFEIIS